MMMLSCYVVRYRDSKQSDYCQQLESFQMIEFPPLHSCVGFGGNHGQRYLEPASRTNIRTEQLLDEANQFASVAHLQVLSLYRQTSNVIMHDANSIGAND